MRPGTRRLALLIALLGTFGAAQSEAVDGELEAILQARCVMCHGGAAPSAGLRLDDLAALLAGGPRGPVVVPGDPEASELVRRLRGTSLPRMPLTGPPYLSDEEIDRFVRWIASGAEAPTPPADPGAAATGSPTAAAAPTTLTYLDVEPILVQNCVRCHRATGIMGPPPEGYRLDTYAEALRADDRARIVPFAPDASELVRRVVGHALPRMPLGGPPWLDDVEVDTIVRWVADGARDAAGRPGSIPAQARLRLHGTWRDDGTLDGLELLLHEARIDDDARRGGHVEVRAAWGGDGRIVVERIRAR